MARAQLMPIVQALNTEGPYEPNQLAADMRNAAVMLSQPSPEEAYGRAAVDFVHMLRRYVHAWEQAKRNYAAALEQNPDMREQIGSALQRNPMHVLHGTERHEELWLRARRMPRPDRPHERAMDEAALLFYALANNPLGSDVRTCNRCRRWYLNTSGHQNKSYCSRKCASLHTTRRRREGEHRQKIERAQAAIRKWEGRRRQGDWKRWVTARAGVTPKFITRAINMAELKEPKSPRRKKS